MRLFCDAAPRGCGAKPRRAILSPPSTRALCREGCVSVGRNTRIVPDTRLFGDQSLSSSHPCPQNIYPLLYSMLPLERSTRLPSYGTCPAEVLYMEIWHPATSRLQYHIFFALQSRHIVFRCYQVVSLKISFQSCFSTSLCLERASVFSAPEKGESATFLPPT